MDQQHQQPLGGKETERKAQVTMDQQLQQPPGGKETERKAQITMDQQHQQPPGGKETERKARVTTDQQHQQPPGGKETSNKNGRYKNRTYLKKLISCHTDRISYLKHGEQVNSEQMQRCDVKRDVTTTAAAALRIQALKPHPPNRRRHDGETCPHNGHLYEHLSRILNYCRFMDDRLEESDPSPCVIPKKSSTLLAPYRDHRLHTTAKATSSITTDIDEFLQRLT
ncbi:hypothetical protein LSAT2_004878 [Lamellibrachia satsuma]|nr:hypothetical protein LSAT2_004878 [Lamellibrachia satsuma]